MTRGQDDLVTRLRGLGTVSGGEAADRIEQLEQVWQAANDINTDCIALREQVARLRDHALQTEVVLRMNMDEIERRWGSRLVSLRGLYKMTEDALAETADVESWLETRLAAEREKCVALIECRADADHLVALVAAIRALGATTGREK
jgi:hypothetical protein